MTDKHEKEFKRLHRRIGLSEHYASDLDLVFVDKNPDRVTAVIDYKGPDEDVKFTQAILYEHLKSVVEEGVYIIRGKTHIHGKTASKQRFDIEKFERTIDRRPSPPKVELTTVRENIPWGGLNGYDNKSDFLKNGGGGVIGWEHKLRNGSLGDASDDEPDEDQRQHTARLTEW